MDTMQVPQGTGSGFIWDMKGHVVTNFHVIRGASDIKVALIDSSVYPAKVLYAPQSKLLEQNHCSGCAIRHDSEHQKLISSGMRHSKRMQCTSLLLPVGSRCMWKALRNAV